MHHFTRQPQVGQRQVRFDRVANVQIIAPRFQRTTLDSGNLAAEDSGQLAGKTSQRQPRVESGANEIERPGNDHLDGARRGFRQGKQSLCSLAAPIGSVRQTSRVLSQRHIRRRAGTKFGRRANHDQANLPASRLVSQRPA